MTAERGGSPVPMTAERGGSPSHPRRVRVAEAVYQRVDRATGKPVAGVSTSSPTATPPDGRSGRPPRRTTKADAKAERAELLARMHKGERVERTALTVGEVARLWLERGTGQQGRWAHSTRERYERIVRLHIEAVRGPHETTDRAGEAPRPHRRPRRRLVGSERARRSPPRRP